MMPKRALVSAPRIEQNKGSSSVDTNGQNTAAEQAPTNSHMSIPASIFRDRSLKPLEVIVEYLKEVEHLTYHQIAKLLNRDDRTIWTVYQRAKRKRK